MIIVDLSWTCVHSDGYKWIGFCLHVASQRSDIPVTTPMIPQINKAWLVKWVPASACGYGVQGWRSIFRRLHRRWSNTVHDYIHLTRHSEMIELAAWWKSAVRCRLPMTSLHYTWDIIWKPAETEKNPNEFGFLHDKTKQGKREEWLTAVTDMLPVEYTRIVNHIVWINRAHISAALIAVPC